MKRLILILAFILTFSIGVFAQSGEAINNSVSVSGAVSRVDSTNLFSGQAEVRKGFGERFVITDIFSVTDNKGTNSGQVVSNQATIRGYLTDFVFVGGGASVSKLVNTNTKTDVVLNPVVQGGVTFVQDRVTLEPMVQLAFPDVLSDNRVRSLSGGLTARVGITDRFGVSLNGGIAQHRVDNRFFQDGGVNVPFGSAGVYFTFN